MFDASIYSARRQALRDRVSGGAILLPGNHHAPRNYADNVYPFRQDSHFLYYAGPDQPGLALLLEPDGAAILYGPGEDPDDVVWFGPHPTTADHATAAGIAEARPIDQLRGRLRALRDAGVAVHYLPPYRGDRTMWLAEQLARDPREIATGVSAELVAAVAEQRSIKAAEEVAEIEEALTVTAEGYQMAMSVIRPGATEAEVAAALQTPALARGRQQAFPPIVSIRGEVLHNESYANTLAAGDLMVIDSGAESARGYASDITRTFPVGGVFSSEQRDVYEVVLAAQQAAIAAAAPGVTNRELHLVAARTIADGLCQLGLMRGDAEAAVAAGAHALLFPHGIGHMLGLDPHDMEDLGDVVGYPAGEARSDQFGLNFLRLAKVLEPGFVITVEPGIYFIPALIDRWAGEGRHREFIDYDRVNALRDFGGIRIEEDVLITGDGARVLGPGIPKSVAKLEEILAE